MCETSIKIISSSQSKKLLRNLILISKKSWYSLMILYNPQTFNNKGVRTGNAWERKQKRGAKGKPSLFRRLVRGDSRTGINYNPPWTPQAKNRVLWLSHKLALENSITKPPQRGGFKRFIFPTLIDSCNQEV